jgi:hypothetical protein
MIAMIELCRNYYLGMKFKKSKCALVLLFIAIPIEKFQILGLFSGESP